MKSVERAFSIEEMRRLARARLPRFVFDLVDGGSGNETTLRANRKAFDAVTFRPRHAVAAAPVSTKTTVFGELIDAPVLVAPCGSARQLHPSGEFALARAAHQLGTGYAVPHLGSYSLEDVRKASDGLLWYQVYLMSDRNRERQAIERAWNAGYKVLIITIDTPAQGLRERDYRNGIARIIGGSSREKLGFLPQLLSRPAWFYGYLRAGAKISFPNMSPPGLPPLTPEELLATTTKVPLPAIWKDVAWCRESWPGPIVVKGVLTREDAELAILAGADGIIVSNHGGRQLDGVPAALAALVEVVDAVAGRTEVFLDSGVRRGSDVAKAISLGAKAVLVGRPAMYGLAAGGETGVRRALSVICEEFARTLLLLGRSSVSQLGPDCVNVPMNWGAAREETMLTGEHDADN